MRKLIISVLTAFGILAISACSKETATADLTTAGTETQTGIDNTVGNENSDNATAVEEKYDVEVEEREDVNNDTANNATINNLTIKNDVNNTEKADNKAANNEIKDKKITNDNNIRDSVTFTDALGREVSVNNPERVVVLLGSFCDEWLLAGGSVVGTVSDTFTNYDYDFSGVTDIGSHMEPDVEQILALNPDFVIATAAMDAQIELLDLLENAGITVAYFEVNSFEDYLNSFEILTKITCRKDLFKEYGTDVALQIETAKAQIDGRKPTVLFIRAAASSVKVKGSEGTVGGEILADLDTINIADSESLLEDISMEAIILADPDYIFVTTQGKNLDTALANVEALMISNPAWNSLSAVKNGNYYVIDKALYNSKPNARWGEAYQKLADIIYKVK